MSTRHKKIKLLAIQFIPLCVLLFYLSLGQAEVTLTVEDGSGFIGSHGLSSVDVSLSNPGDIVKAVQVDICDVDNYLSCTGCEVLGRASDFLCKTNERDNGCCGVLLVTVVDPDGDIVEGTGSIFTLTYNVSAGAPEGECRNLDPENVAVTDTVSQPLEVTSVSGEFCFEPCSSDGDCEDALFCNGGDSCESEICVHTGDPCPSGTMCDEETDSCLTTTTTSIASTTTTTVSTTTTAPIVTTTIPTMSTTTTTVITSSCKVSISPLSATLISGTSMQFSARTECDGEEVAGSYDWQIVPDSTIGSAIDGEGLFTAGDNTTASDIEETVRVTDSAHENKSATATVTIRVKQTPVGCEIAISPLAATVLPGEMLTLVASAIGDCDTPLYEWALTTETDSLHEPQGGTCDYMAGANDGTESLTDVMTVSDTVNGIDAEAEITILAEGVSIEVSPENLWKSHLIHLPYLIVIKGEGTHFKAFGTSLSFDPPEAAFSLLPLVLGNSSIWDIILVMPSWLAGGEDRAVTVTVTTEDEVVSDDFTLKLLPLILDQSRSLQ